MCWSQCGWPYGSDFKLALGTGCQPPRAEPGSLLGMTLLSPKRVPLATCQVCSQIGQMHSYPAGGGSSSGAGHMVTASR